MARTRDALTNCQTYCRRVLWGQDREVAMKSIRVAIGLCYVAIIILMGGCGDIHRAYEETTPSSDPMNLAKPVDQGQDGTPKYEDGLVSGPTCTENDDKKYSKGQGYILRSFVDVVAKSQTAAAVKWKDADQDSFKAAPDKFLPGDIAVFKTRDSHTISWDIEWHHRQVNPKVAQISYTMTRCTTVPFATTITNWHGVIQLVDVADGVTGFTMDNYIAGRPSCENSNGSITDIFNNLH